MDYRCPVCGKNLEKRRFSQAIVARINIDCFHCRNTIRLNIHRTEVIAVLLIFGAIIVLGALGYWLRSDGFVLAAFGAAMLGALVLPVLERTYLRSWRRYAATVENPKA